MNTIKVPSDLRTVSIRTRQHGEEKSFCYRDVITGDVKINYL